MSYGACELYGGPVRDSGPVRLVSSCFATSPAALNRNADQRTRGMEDAASLMEGVASPMEDVAPFMEDVASLMEDLVTGRCSGSGRREPSADDA